MANEESFISEVNEEVRKERLFGLLRKYGWIAGLAVLALVGGAAWNEYNKAEARAQAQALGDAIVSAAASADPRARAAALSSFSTTGPAAALTTLLASAEVDRADAIAALEALSRDIAQPAHYRDLATLKSVMLQAASLSPQDRIAQLQPLTLPGSAYRLLAQEQTALARIDAGEIDQARAILTDLIGDSEATEGLRRRASQLIVALGGSVDAS